MKRAFSEDSAESSSPQEAASYTRRHAEERGGSHEPPRDKKRHLNSVKIKRPKIFAKRESSCSRATSGYTRNSYRARPEWNDSEDDSSDSDASGGEFAAQIGESRGKTKIKKKKSPSHQEKMQVVRTMQLLNALLKQQKNHAMQYSTLNDARLDPTALAVSYENMLTQVHKKHASLVSHFGKTGVQHGGNLSAIQVALAACRASWPPHTLHSLHVLWLQHACTSSHTKSPSASFRAAKLEFQLAACVGARQHFVHARGFCAFRAGCG